MAAWSVRTQVEVLTAKRWPSTPDCAPLQRPERSSDIATPLSRCWRARTTRRVDLRSRPLLLHADVRDRARGREAGRMDRGSGRARGEVTGRRAEGSGRNSRTPNPGEGFPDRAEGFGGEAGQAQRVMSASLEDPHGMSVVRFRRLLRLHRQLSNRRRNAPRITLTPSVPKVSNLL